MYSRREKLLSNMKARRFQRNIPPYYTLPQKKCNFSEVAFLLGRSVGQWNFGQMSFYNAPGTNLSKTPFQNSSPFSHRLIFFNGVFCLLLLGAFPLVDMTTYYIFFKFPTNPLTQQTLGPPTCDKCFNFHARIYLVYCSGISVDQKFLLFIRPWNTHAYIPKRHTLIRVLPLLIFFCYLLMYVCILAENCN